jgi:alkylmercury lyase
MLSAPIEEIAASILEHMPPLTPDGARVALATYRLLASGAPVGVKAIAERTGRNAEQADGLLSSWPGVFRDDAQRVIGFWGLSITKLGPHRLHVDGKRLSAWCAWDTLFLPELLAQPADVESRSPLDGEPITLRVTPERVRDTSPANLVVSMVPARESDDLIRTFCHHIHFFGSAAEGERWITDREGAFLMPLHDAFELAMRVNRARYGSALTQGT